MLESRPAGRSLLRRPAVRLPLLVALGYAVVWGLVQVVPVSIASAGGRRVLLVVVTAAAVVLAASAAAAWVWGRTSGGAQRAADTIVVGTAVLVSGSATAALHGTEWGFNGLAADASFRTEAATRYADAAHLTDYAYSATPAYYPPALGWLQGRTAALLDVPAWTIVQPLQLLLAAVVPLAAYAMWRRLLPPLPAAAVAAAVCLLTADLLKVDEWLVLVCAVPWWMDLVRGVRADGVRRWPWWGHGLFAGLILLTHTFYLLPLAVATVLGWAVDLVRRRRLELRPLRAVGVMVVGLVVASPYWVPTVVARLGGAPSDDLQLRYSYAGANVPPWPLPWDRPGALGLDVPGTLGLIGVVWLLWSAWAWRRGRPDPLAGAVALVLVASYLTMLVGAIAVGFDVGLLTFKTDELVILTMTVAGVCGLVRVSYAVRSTRWLIAVAAVAVLVLVVAAAEDFAGHWVTGRPAKAAQTTRYPDGSMPTGGVGLPLHEDGPAFVRPGDPSVREVQQAWTDLTGSALDSDDVVVTSRVDLLATTPFHLFLTWKSIYSNPLGRFEARLDLLRRVTDCPDPACAHDLLTDNPYDRVDGLVLERRGDDLVMPVLVDDFPDRSSSTEVTFPAAVFSGPGFELADVGRLTVVVPRAAG